MVCVVVVPRFTRIGTICSTVAQRRGTLCGNWGVTTDLSSDYLFYLFINFATLSIWNIPNLCLFLFFAFILILSKL